MSLGCGEAGKFELVRLANGTWSLRSLEVGETFHPVVGPEAEAEALYVRQMGLPGRIGATPATGEFVVWDVGMGSAANVLAVLRGLGGGQGEGAHRGGRLRILSFDKTLEPLEVGMGGADRLGYYRGFEREVRELLVRRRVTFEVGGRPVFWEVLVGDFPSWVAGGGTDSGGAPDAILYDAFSPARNPEMWTLPLFEGLYRLLGRGKACSLATYSRSTLLRVTLLLAGFWVGSGARTGEKEETTLAANDPGLAGALLDRGWLGRVGRSTSAAPLREPVYRQGPLAAADAERLEAHPQFRIADKFVA